MEALKRNIRKKARVSILITCLITVLASGIALNAVWQTNRVVTHIVPQAEAMLIGVKDIYSQGFNRVKPSATSSWTPATRPPIKT